MAIGLYGDKSQDSCALRYRARDSDSQGTQRKGQIRARQLGKLASDCRTKEACNLGLSAHHSMTYSETALMGDEAVTG